MIINYNGFSFVYACLCCYGEIETLPMDEKYFVLWSNTWFAVGKTTDKVWVSSAIIIVPMFPKNLKKLGEIFVAFWNLKNI